jgi:predicted RNase H-like nuclease
MHVINQDAWLAGVDGCAGGWIAVFVRPQSGETRVRIVPGFADVLSAPERPEIVAVDMPIGLPERSARGGPRNCVRPLLERQ